MTFSFTRGILTHLRQSRDNPCYPFSHYLKQIVSAANNVMDAENCLVIVYIDIKGFHKIEGVFGTETSIKILDTMDNLLRTKAPDIISGQGKIIISDKLLGDDYIVVYASPSLPEIEELHNISLAWKMNLKEIFNKHSLKKFGIPLDIHVGCSVITRDPGGNFESRLYMAIREAEKKSHGLLDEKNAKLVNQFTAIVRSENFNIVYQPIVSLCTGVVLGWEALTRGPAGTNFMNPQVIFSFAGEINMLYPVEKVCRQLALKNLGEISRDQKIFLNIHPHTINDKNFVKGETLEIIKKCRLNQSNIVFEITEQADVNNIPEFKKTLEHYRGQGYMVAIDDVGAGFSSLQSIAKIRPDFIKMDMSLVHGVDSDPVKKALLETFVTLADKIGCSIIAEGIETESQLNALIKMGVHYGQGFFLGRPVSPKAYPAAELCLNITKMSSRSKHMAWRHSMPVGDIIEECVTVEGFTPINEVKKILEMNDPLSGAVVLNGQYPEGLIMKHTLFAQLCTQYGMALYSHRPAEALMDRVPLVIDWQAPVETVSQVAMSRDKGKLYDHVIVTKESKYLGVVSMQNLMNALTRVQLEMAKGANPLTGLPGNNAIEQEIGTRLNLGKPFVLAYIDLDNFKSYNDKYGFENGDRVILFTSRLVNSAARKYGSVEDFLGHVGGDDFVLIACPEKIDIICQKIIRYFDRLIKRLYHPEDMSKMGIAGKDRDGMSRWFPFVSISIAIIECGYPGAAEVNIIANKAAELKNYAKTLIGSVYVRERRQHHQTQPH